MDDVTGFLWTNHYDEAFSFQMNQVTKEDLTNNGFDPSKDTKIIAHGWGQEGLEFGTQFAYPYMLHFPDQFNIISVNWQLLAPIEDYLFSAQNTYDVGEMVGESLVHQVLMNQLG